MPAYLSPEWFRWYTPLHGDACDYGRMVRIMRLREMARYGTSDTQQWARLTNTAEQFAHRPPVSEVRVSTSHTASSSSRMPHDAPYDWDGPWWMFCPRQVCAKRARVLRKRGMTVAYACRTSTGRARYWWDSVDARAPAPVTDEEQSHAAK